MFAFLFRRKPISSEKRSLEVCRRPPSPADHCSPGICFIFVKFCLPLRIGNNRSKIWEDCFRKYPFHRGFRKGFTKERKKEKCKTVKTNGYALRFRRCCSTAVSVRCTDGPSSARRSLISSASPRVLPSGRSASLSSSSACLRHS